MGIGPGPDSRSLLQFFLLAGRLKGEKRRGWMKKLGMEHPESVADHSFRTAVMAMFVSDARGLDTGRAVRLALLHDLPEALVGDAMPEERSGRRKTELETKAMDEILSELPAASRALYRDAWHDFVDGRSEESRLVRELDKLEMALQAREYANESGDPSKAKEFWKTAREHVKDRELMELLSQVEP